MTDTDTLSRDIFETGKLIQDRVFRVINVQLEKMEQEHDSDELTAHQVRTILMVHMRGRISMTALSKLLSISPPSASVMVDRLVEKDLLERKHSDTDRRKVEVTVSEKAIGQIEQVEAAILQSFAELVDKVGADTAREWHRILKKIRPVLEEDAAM